MITPERIHFRAWKWFPARRGTEKPKYLETGGVIGGGDPKEALDSCAGEFVGAVEHDQEGLWQVPEKDIGLPWGWAHPSPPPEIKGTREYKINLTWQIGQIDRTDLCVDMIIGHHLLKDAMGDARDFLPHYLMRETMSEIERVWGWTT